MKKVIISNIIFILTLTGCSLPYKKKITERKDDNKIIYVSGETAGSIGLMTEVASIKKVNFQLKFNGIVKEVPNKSFLISSPVNGRVLKVLVEPNQVVSKGEELADISSQDVAELQFDISKEEIDIEGLVEQAKLELGLAKTSYERESKLYKDGITAKKDFLEAENRLKRAENNLDILERKKEAITDLSEKRLSILGAHTKSSQAGFAEIRSPGDSVILRRLINPGEVVEKDKALFEASDLREVLVESQIYEKDLPKVGLGKKVNFTSEACPNEIFNGEISYVAQVANPETRTIAVRAKIKNPGHKLKPEMFGKMFITLSEEDALVISKEAVQRVDNEAVIYVRHNKGFKEIKAKLGRETDGLIEIINGIKPHEEVATQGSYWLKSELHAD